MHAAQRILDVQALSLLIEDGETRVITKKGIQMDGTHFFAPELAAYVGQRVFCIRHPGDMGKIAVFRLLPRGRQFACWPDNLDRAGVDRQVMAIEARRVQTR